MRAIHLNYHEITEDPRVTKECTSLADRGYEITVVCALHDDALPVEKVGDLDVRRIRWKEYDGLSDEYVEELKELRRSYPYIKLKLERALLIKKLRPRVGELLQEVLPDRATTFDLKKYKELRGLERIAQKFRGRYYLRLFKGLLKKPEFADLRKMLGDFGVELEEFMTTKPQTKTPLFQAESFLFDANLRALNLSGPAEIVHAHDIYTLPAGVALAKRLCARLIYDAHEFEPERAAKMPPEGNAMVDAIELDCLENVDAVITVSDSISELYSERFAKRKPVVILNAPDISWPDRSKEQFQQFRESFRAKLDLDAETPLIGYTGWVLKEQRGLGTVAKALALLPDFHLVILGPRHEQDDNKLLEIAKLAGVKDRIHLLEPVHYTEVVPTISACDVSIVPFQDAGLSYRFAMPNKLFEGVFAGLPVCVSDLPDMRRFVETLGRGRVMDQTDPKSIAETISHLYTHRSDFKITEDQHKSLVSNYSWSAQVEKLGELYDELLQKDRPIDTPNGPQATPQP